MYNNPLVEQKIIVSGNIQKSNNKDEQFEKISSANSRRPWITSRSFRFLQLSKSESETITETVNFYCDIEKIDD